MTELRPKPNRLQPKPIDLRPKPIELGSKLTELRPKPTINGVKQNGGSSTGRAAIHRPGRKAENGPGAPRIPLVAFSDQAVGEVDDPDTAGATALSCSVEALSLIPGRDINHEGPHRVYQWTDF